MDVVHLPILTSDSPLKDAVRAMRVQQRSALVRETHTDLALVKIPKVFAALSDGLTQLSNVKNSEPVYRPSPAEMASAHLDERNPRRTEAEWQTFLDSVGYSYALLDSFLGTALVVTRHEPQGDEIRKFPQDCYCNGPHEHSYPPPTVVKGKCPQCAGTVHCE